MMCNFVSVVNCRLLTNKLRFLINFQEKNHYLFLIPLAEKFFEFFRTQIIIIIIIVIKIIIKWIINGAFWLFFHIHIHTLTHHRNRKNLIFFNLMIILYFGFIIIIIIDDKNGDADNDIYMFNAINLFHTFYCNLLH